MGRIYFYKLTVDAGAAPCVQRGMLSLAITASLGITPDRVELIFGGPISCALPRISVGGLRRCCAELRYSEVHSKIDRAASRGRSLISPSAMLNVYLNAKKAARLRVPRLPEGTSQVQACHTTSPLPP